METKTSTVIYDQLVEDAERLGVFIEEQPLEYEVCGIYDHEDHIIVLDPCLSDTQRLCTLCHELNHVRYKDTMSDHWTNAKCERRTRRDTALQLISPIDYRMAEYTYDGISFLMASDLGVTLQVLEDYQALLMHGVIDLHTT